MSSEADDVREAVDRYSTDHPAAGRWARGYGRIQHDVETQARVPLPGNPSSDEESALLFNDSASDLRVPVDERRDLRDDRRRGPTAASEGRGPGRDAIEPHDPHARTPEVPGDRS